MNTTATRSAALSCLAAAALLLAPPTAAKPAAHKHAVHHPAPAAVTNPAVAAVREYLAARAGGEIDRAYALLSANTQAQFPAAQREQMARQFTGPDMLRTLPPSVLPVLAMFGDIHDTLHFKFRALGPSPDDPIIVLVRAYQVGAPLSSIQTIRVVTLADAAAGGARRLDGEKTAMLAGPALMGGRSSAQQATSMSNMKQIALGILMYAEDNDHKMPDADKWVDEVMPYIKTESVFADPAAPGLKWAYAFNRALSGVSLADLEDPAGTVLLFESTDGKKNASDRGESLPRPGRHNGGTDYAMADGHVKWVGDDAPRPSFETAGK